MQTTTTIRNFLSRLGLDIGGLILSAALVAWGGIAKGVGVALIYLAIVVSYLLLKGAFRYFRTGHFLCQLEESTTRPN